MRSFYPAIILMLVLWVLMTAVFPAWVPVRFIPNLVLVGVLVFAITSTDPRTLLLAAVSGLVLDVQSSVLIGSFTIPFTVVYVIVHALFRGFVPADRVYIGLPTAFIVSEIVIALWVSFLGLIAANLGWQVTPYLTAHLSFAYGMTLLLGSALALVIYVVWLEVQQRTERPIRLRA